MRTDRGDRGKRRSHRKRSNRKERSLRVYNWRGRECMCWRFIAFRESEARTAGILKRPSESRAAFCGRRKKGVGGGRGRKRRRRRRERSNGRSIHPPPSSSSPLLLFLPNEENDHVRSPPHLPTLVVSLAGVEPVLVSPFTRKEIGGVKNLGAANFAARLQKKTCCLHSSPGDKKSLRPPAVQQYSSCCAVALGCGGLPPILAFP